MVLQILQWTTDDCVGFLRKCAKRIAGSIPESELEKFVLNFQQNYVVGSTILKFSDAEWNALTPAIGLQKFVRQELCPLESKCEQEARAAIWNSRPARPSAKQVKLEPKDMPCKLSIASYFSKFNKAPIVGEFSNC